MKNKKNNSNTPFFLIIMIPLLLVLIFALVAASKSGGLYEVSDNNSDITDIDSQKNQNLDETKHSGQNKIDNEVIPEPKKEYRNITFAAAGDILVHTNVYKYASQLAQGTDAEYDFKPMFANIKEIISSADLAYVNQETPCAGKERGYSGYPTFNTPDEIADAVLDTGFDIVNIANNHMLDKGESGLARNIDF